MSATHTFDELSAMARAMDGERLLKRIAVCQYALDAVDAYFRAQSAANTALTLYDDVQSVGHADRSMHNLRFAIAHELHACKDELKRRLGIELPENEIPF